MNTLETDILILGAGGAGLFAALHAKKANPDLDPQLLAPGQVVLAIASKGPLHKQGHRIAFVGVELLRRRRTVRQGRCRCSGRVRRFL